MSHMPIQLLVEEPLPGAYAWTLKQTDADGRHVRTLRRSADSYESYETALAAGSHALGAQMQQSAPPQRQQG